MSDDQKIDHMVIGDDEVIVNIKDAFKAGQLGYVWASDDAYIVLKKPQLKSEVEL
jgi:hypothetical protein